MLFRHLLCRYLVKGTPVVYVTFADQTGVILCRADGAGASIGSAMISEIREKENGEGTQS